MTRDADKRNITEASPRYGHASRNQAHGFYGSLRWSTVKDTTGPSICDQMLPDAKAAEIFADEIEYLSSEFPVLKLLDGMKGADPAEQRTSDSFFRDMLDSATGRHYFDLWETRLENEELASELGLLDLLPSDPEDFTESEKSSDAYFAMHRLDAIRTMTAKTIRRFFKTYDPADYDGDLAPRYLM